MKTRFTFNQKELARMIMDKLQKEGKLAGGTFDVYTAVRPPSSGRGFEVIFEFEESK
jgi:hypothetical protein